MKKTITLKKNYEFKNILKKGKYFKGKYLEGFFLKNNKNFNYIGIAISSKLCHAVKRNRIKRVIRESYRNIENNIKTGITIIFMWNKKADIENCKYNNVKEDMIKILKKIDIYCFK